MTGYIVLGGVVLAAIAAVALAYYLDHRDQHKQGR